MPKLLGVGESHAAVHVATGRAGRQPCSSADINFSSGSGREGDWADGCPSLSAQGTHLWASLHLPICRGPTQKLALSITQPGVSQSEAPRVPGNLCQQSQMNLLEMQILSLRGNKSPQVALSIGLAHLIRYARKHSSSCELQEHPPGVCDRL